MINSFEGKYRFLSNFHLCTIVFEGAVYSSVEHAYQAWKTLSASERTRIMLATTPGMVKRFGQEVTLRPDYSDETRINAMYGFLLQKFNRTPLLQRLQGTSPEDIVEGNTWGDTFWGVCDGDGRNHMGRLLMRIRDELAESCPIGNYSVGWESAPNHRVELGVTAPDGQEVYVCDLDGTDEFCREICHALDMMQDERRTLVDALRDDTFCAYCGEKYPHGTPKHSNALLTEHIKKCEKHPAFGMNRTLNAIHCYVTNATCTVPGCQGPLAPDPSDMCEMCSVIKHVRLLIEKQGVLK